MINFLKEHDLTISSVESFTGGAFIASLIEQEGASASVVGSLVLYQNAAKEEFGIDTSNGVVNEQVAKQMIAISKERFNSDICVSFTGNVGLTEVDGKKGQQFIALSYKDNLKVIELLAKNNDRKSNIDEAIKIAKEEIKLIIEKNHK